MEWNCPVAVMSVTMPLLNIKDFAAATFYQSRAAAEDDMLLHAQIRVEELV